MTNAATSAPTGLPVSREKPPSWHSLRPSSYAAGCSTFYPKVLRGCATTALPVLRPSGQTVPSVSTSGRSLIRFQNSRNRGHLPAPVAALTSPFCANSPHPPPARPTRQTIQSRMTHTSRFKNNTSSQAMCKERALRNPANRPRNLLETHIYPTNRPLGKNRTTSLGQSPCDRPRSSRIPDSSPSRNRPAPVGPLIHGHKSETHKARAQPR